MSTTADRPLRDLVRQTAIYGLGNVSLSLLGLVLVPVYTHHLAPADFGLLALVLAVSGFLTSVYDLGMMNAVGRWYFDARASADPAASVRRMATSAQLFLVVHGGALTALVWVFAPALSRALTGTPQEASLLRIAALGLYGTALTIVPLTLVRMEERARYFVALSCLRFAGALGLNILFVVVLGWGVRGILLGNALMAGATLLALGPEFARIIGGRPSPGVLRQMLAFALPYWPVLLSTWVIDSSDRYFLEVYATRDDLGQYALGYKVAQVVQLAVATFSMGWAPLRYRIYARADAVDVYRKLTSYYVIAAGLLVVGLSLVGHEIVALVAPPSYARAGDVVAALSLGYALYGLFVVMVTGMGVTKRTAPMAWIAAAAAAVNLAANVALIPGYGMAGAAAATVLANLVLAGGSWYCSERVYPIPQDWRLMSWVVVLGTGFVWLDRMLQPAQAVRGTAVAVVLFSVFVASLFAGGVLRRADVGLARAWFRDVVRSAS